MGTIDLSKSMKLSGKLGPMIAYVRKDGTQIFRAYSKPKNPKTPKQIEQRARFSLVNKELSPLRVAINRGHPGVDNAYRKAVGRAYHKAIEGRYPDLRINFGKIRVAKGDIPLPKQIEVNFNLASNQVTFRWSPLAEEDLSKGSEKDLVNIAYFNSDDPNLLLFFEKAKRVDGKACITLGEEWQLSSTHFWFFFTSQNWKKASMSVYITSNLSNKGDEADKNADLDMDDMDDMDDDECVVLCTYEEVGVEGYEGLGVDNSENTREILEKHPENSRKIPEEGLKNTQKPLQNTQKPPHNSQIHPENAQIHLRDNQKTPRKLLKNTQKSFSKVQEEIIELVKSNPSITRKDLETLLQRSHDSIKHHLLQLTKKGVLRREGSDRAGKWIVVD